METTCPTKEQVEEYFSNLKVLRPAPRAAIRRAHRDIIKLRKAGFEFSIMGGRIHICLPEVSKGRNAVMDQGAEVRRRHGSNALFQAILIETRKEGAFVASRSFEGGHVPVQKVAEFNDDQIHLSDKPEDIVGAPFVHPAGTA